MKKAFTKNTFVRKTDIIFESCHHQWGDHLNAALWGRSGECYSITTKSEMLSFWPRFSSQTLPLAPPQATSFLLFSRVPPQ